MTSPAARIAALAGPVLLAAYGIARHLDGLDGDRGPGALWNAGHLAFLVSTLAFGVLAVRLAQDAAGRRAAPARIAVAALAVALLGVALSCWVLLVDLGVPAGPVPGAVATGGPALLGVGLVALLLTQVGRRLPLWSPLTFLVADVSTGIDLDLITPAAAVMAVALWPLVRTDAARDVSTRRVGAATPGG